MMDMHNPLHSGEILRVQCIEPLGLSINEETEGLGLIRKTLSVILNARSGISPEMAVRLSLVFGTSYERWLNQQSQYDLWGAEKKRKQLNVKKLSAA